MTARLFAVSLCLLLSACAEAPEDASVQSYDLDLIHPSKYANYISVAPGPQAAPMPRPRQINSRGFSRYLRGRTGCVVDPSRDMAVLGDKAMPAGYMVPVVCP